jgi:glycine/D-amino acid oxidase-like deaminating enzyme
MNRQELIAKLARPITYDVAVIGGGATGLGVALDASARGFSVVLVEAHDFAKGTSSRATKLVHGGVRYLAQGNISLVREALLHGVGEGAHDVLLTDHLAEALRAVPTIERRGFGHESSLSPAFRLSRAPRRGLPETPGCDQVQLILRSFATG